MFKHLAPILIFLASSAPLFAQDRITVVARTAVLRGTPDSAGVEVATLKSRDSAELIITRGDWHLIQTDQHVGWIETRAIVKDTGILRDGVGAGGGMGIGQGSGSSRREQSGGTDTGRIAAPLITTPLKFLSRPNPSHTTASRENKVEGIVMLRVTFLASGKVGAISVIRGLPHGLTEQAVNAAKMITFEPARSNGIPQSVTGVLEYTFSVY